ncbi:MAG: hypothetical protein EOP88_03350 [Verrucomicrobiaceae bacterium]|nr:MAG: hypothetical protein EOP88_03350 [Verrucomicrobiaceae bacterium]
MSDGNLITRVDGLLGTRMDYGIKRLPGEPGMLAFEADLLDGRWTVEIDLDRSTSATVTEVNPEGETKVSHAPVEATTLNRSPIPLPRLKGDLSISERITFLLPRGITMPGGEAPYVLRVEVHFLNREPLGWH